MRCHDTKCEKNWVFSLAEDMFFEEQYENCRKSMILDKIHQICGFLMRWEKTEQIILNHIQVILSLQSALARSSRPNSIFFGSARKVANLISAHLSPFQPSSACLGWSQPSAVGSAHLSSSRLSSALLNSSQLLLTLPIQAQGIRRAGTRPLCCLEPARWAAAGEQSRPPLPPPHVGSEDEKKKASSLEKKARQKIKPGPPCIPSSHFNSCFRETQRGGFNVRCCEIL